MSECDISVPYITQDFWEGFRRIKEIKDRTRIIMTFYYC